jgi:hypothetical protein
MGRGLSNHRRAFPGDAAGSRHRYESRACAGGDATHERCSGRGRVFPLSRDWYAQFLQAHEGPFGVGSITGLYAGWALEPLPAQRHVSISSAVLGMRSTSRAAPTNLSVASPPPQSDQAGYAQVGGGGREAGHVDSSRKF